MSTKSANRPPRDKHNKSAATDKTKSDVISSNKIQPTAEQMQMARIMNNDSNKGEDPEVTAKIRQVQELTGASEDDALFALYDFNYDLDRAVEKLLESSDTQNEWHTISKKEKSQPAPKPEPVVNSKPDLRREKSKDRDYIPERNDSSGPRNRRERGPPRFQRGRGRERPVMEEDRNMADFAGGERNFDRSERGGRGRGRGGGPGRGRGRGRNNPNFRGTRFDTNRDKGPHIDTWTNEQAETNADKENIGSWGDMAEDWTSEDWQGNLDEPKIFTASSNTPSTDIFSPSMNDNDAKMFSPPVSIETQVFTSATIPVSAVSPTLNDTTNTFQHGNSPLPQAAMSTGTIGHNSISQQPALGQSPNLGPRLDISTFFNTGETSSPPSQQNQFMSRFAKEATESIKNAVGIGNAAAGQQAPVGLPPANVNDVSRSMAPPSGQSSSPVIGNAASQRATAAKVQRTKLPPPSKIPASAVEMPGSMNSFNLDVQFGNWDLGSDSGSSSLGFGSVISTGVSVSSNYASSAPTIAPTQPQVTSMLDGLTPSETSPHNAGPVYQNPVSTTPPKDYSQSSIKSTTISTPPDPIPFPSPNERKASPYGAQRSSQNTGSVTSNKPASSPMAYNQSSYQSSSYQSSYKPAITSSTSYSHTNNGLPSSALSHPSPNQYNSTGAYQTSSFQNQSGYSTNQNQNSLYQGSTNQSSAYSAQSGGGTAPYSTGSGSTYQSQGSYANQSPSAYPAQSYSRDNGQSASSGYPSSGGNQAGGSAYQSSVVSQAGSTPYQTGSVSQSAGAGYPTSVNQAASAAYSTGVNQSPSVGYQSGVVSQSAGSPYQSGSASQAASSYQTNVSQSNTPVASTNYSQPPSQVNYNHQGYAQNSHQNSLSAGKLNDSMGKISMADAGLDGQVSQYEHSGSTSSASLTTTTSTTASSLASGGVSVSASLGLSTTTASASATNPMAKSALPLTTKAPPNLPPGVPLIQNYMTIGQPNMAPFAFASLAAQQPMYSYEDLQLLQQRLPMPGYSYDMPLQPATTAMTGRDQTAQLAQVPYSGTADNKMPRVDAQSPVNAQTTQQQQTPSAHQQSQQQAFINPTQLPPGYNFYYPTAGGVIPGGYSYPPTMFPVSVTNTAHGGTTASVPFQKPGAYGSHAYGTAGQTQDFSKAYSGASTGQNKVSSGSIVTSSATDLTGTGASYGKTHAQSFDKAAFHAGTPPPFNLPLPTGTQAGPMGGPTAYGAPYVPVMTHQPHSQMLHHPLQQDSTGGSARSSQQAAAQNKAAVGKTFSTYWGPN